MASRNESEMAIHEISAGPLIIVHFYMYPVQYCVYYTKPCTYFKPCSPVAAAADCVSSVFIFLRSHQVGSYNAGRTRSHNVPQFCHTTQVRHSIDYSIYHTLQVCR